MKTPLLIATGVAVVSAGSALWLLRQPASAAANEHGQPDAGYSRLELTTEFWSEGAAFGDFNRDGESDLVAGPYWWQGPDFETRHAFAPDDQRRSPGGAAPHRVRQPDGSFVSVAGFPGAYSGTNGYSDSFIVAAHDFNGDGWDDILIVGFPGAATHWYENPRGESGHWKKHLVHPSVGNESPTLADLVGDDTPELVFNTPAAKDKPGRLGYATPDPDDPTAPWAFHPISEPGPFGRFLHGLGVGDVDGDGRRDVILKDGWWRQPESLEGEPTWEHHPHRFANKGGAQMFAHDVNDDGRQDVITSLDGHGHGLAWFEQLEDGGFEKHLIMGESAADSAGGVVFTQPHALVLTDVDGDELPDIILGKRFWAHGPQGDVDPNGTPVVYAYLLRRDDSGVRFEPRLLDDASGVGTQFAARDLDGDGRPEFAIANKRGVHLLRSEAP